jgi:hypothetical protein
MLVSNLFRRAPILSGTIAQGRTLTTTAYDSQFIASDIAFTDNNNVVTLQIPFRKVKRIGEVVIGMAGCLECMIDFSNMIVQYVTGASNDMDMPAAIPGRADRDFVVLVHAAGTCLKYTKAKGSNDVTLVNITQIPTVIGSGSHYVTTGFNEHKNAVVAVLEAMKQDPYTGGEVKYCNIHREDVHNLEIHPMSNVHNLQVTGVQNELEATTEFMQRQENVGKVFRASTEVHYVGTPDPMPLEAGLAILKQGLAKVRAQYTTK